MKKLLFAASFALIATACEKKQETGTITTQNTEIANPETTTTTTVTPVDSATAIAHTDKVTTADKTVTTKNTTGEVYHYISNDKKTEFSVIYDAEKGTAAVKNETTGKTYDMKTVVSASGAKYQDKDGNYFWEHQGGFVFGKGNQDLIEGKLK